MYALALSFSGFEVVAAQDIGEACRRASEIVPDIIVVDLPMPDGDGWQILQDLKHHPRIRGVPMVATSGYVQRSMQERVERDGFAAFVAKPCLPRDLAMGLRRVLDRASRVEARQREATREITP